MTDSHNLPRASDPPPPATPVPSHPNDPAEATLSPRAQVNEAILAFGSALGVANALAFSLDTVPVSVLTLTISQLCAALEDVTVAAVQVSTAISVALAPTEADTDTDTAATATNNFLCFTAPWIAGNLYGVVPLAPWTAIPDRNERWFAITRGRYVGLTTNSAISVNAVTGVPSGLSTSCASQAEALNHFNVALAADAIAIFE
ncbi:hypothetical protein B0H16DRAFT_1741601 [Mycena metata]|uniref:Uncharacterized protein n=1 Tax=Mycena metata TaxID=1033252 RepID=A0AAD7HAP2_9AGAR|nr:hypothetical protein B0H16DRAFT_1741601 [Mycena metata]